MANVAVSLKSIVEHFESLPDPRHTRNRLHLLGDVLVISVCGVIVGCSGPTSIARWAKAARVRGAWQTIFHGFAASRSACSNAIPRSTASKARARSPAGAMTF